MILVPDSKKLNVLVESSYKDFLDLNSKLDWTNSTLTFWSSDAQRGKAIVSDLKTTHNHGFSIVTHSYFIWHASPYGTASN